MGVLVAALPGALSAAASVAFGFSSFFGLTGLTGALLAGATMLALGTAINLLSPKPKTPQLNTGTQLQTYEDPIFPRAFIYGQAATGGSLAYWETNGTDNKELWMVYVWQDTPAESIVDVRVNGKAFTWTGSPLTGTGDYANKIFRFDHLGSESQTVDSDLDSASTNWTSSHRGRGICYTVFHLTYDTKAWPSGRPPFLGYIKGRKIYDPRLDSTYPGGSGAHREDDETTWAWSDNPVLCLLDYLRGVKMNGQIIGGAGVPIAAIDLASFVTAANICDQLVSLKAGGTEKRYRCGGLVTTNVGHQVVIEALLATFDGVLISDGGTLKLFAGAAQTVTVNGGAAYTDDDLAGPLRVDTTRSIQEKVNAVFITYIDPNANYEQASAAPRTDANLEAEDGGQRLAIEEPIGFCQSATQAQRLAKIRLGHEREQLVIQGTYKLKMLEPQTGDVFYWSSDTFGYSNKKMRLMERAIQSDGSVQITARSETDTKYDWTPATDELDAALFDQISGFDPAVITGPSTGNLTITALELSSTTSTRPGISVAVDVSAASPFVKEIYVQFKRNAASDWQAGPILAIASPYGIIDGVNPSTLYDVRVAYRSLFGTFSTWATVSSAVTTTALKILQQSALPMNNTGGGITSRNPATPLTATDAGSTATISIAAFTQYFDFGSVSYNSGSITGLAFSTKYHVYCDDPNYAGGAVTYVATTTYTNAIAAGRNYIGSITTPADGAGGTSQPTSECVDADSFLPEGKRARDLCSADTLTTLNGTRDGLASAIVTDARAALEPCRRLVSTSGVSLVCSRTTPFTLRSGRICLAHELVRGMFVAVLDSNGFRWERLAAIEDAGVRAVMRIEAGGATYAAGEQAGRYIFSHNPIKP